MLKLAPVLVLLVCVAGCASDDSTSDPKPAKTSLPAILKPQLPAPISAAEAPVAALTDIETKRVSLSSPDWLATAAGALWVRLDVGQVVRLDPRTGAIKTRIDTPAGDGKCQAFGSAGDEAVYSCAYDGTIARIDPASDKVEAEVKSSVASDQGHLVTAEDKVWVLTAEGDEIVPIDPDDDSLGKPIKLGGYCVELGGGGSVVYAACTSDGLVIRVDAERQKVTHRLALPEPRTIGASSAGVFVSYADGVAQLDPENLEPAAVYDVPLNLGGGIFADDERALLRADGGPFLTVIDPVAHDVLQTVTAPDLPSGGSALRIGDIVWATAYDDGTLVGLKTE